MINKYTNKQRGLLAVILAIAMVFTGAAFVVAEVDAASNVMNVSNETELNDAMTDNSVSEVVLTAGFETSNSIAIYKSLNLGGNTIKYTGSGWGGYGMHIYAADCVISNGTIENTGGGKCVGAVSGNNGTVTFNGVTFSNPNGGAGIATGSMIVNVVDCDFIGNGYTAVYMNGGCQSVTIDSATTLSTTVGGSFGHDGAVTNGDCATPVINADCTIPEMSIYNYSDLDTTGIQVNDVDKTVFKAGTVPVTTTIDIPGDVVEISGNLTVSNSGKIVVDGDFVVPAGSTLTNNGEMEVSGEITVNGTAGGTGQIQNDVAKEVVTLSGVLESDVVGKVSQIITVTDDLVVKDGVSIIVNGAFVVEADAEVTFESGSTIVFGMGSEATIDGDIIIEGAETGATFSFGGYKMAVNGSVTLDGANAFACTGAVEIAGYFEVSDVASAAFTNGATVLAGGELMIYGIASGNIVNNGTVTIDSEGIAKADSTGLADWMKSLNIQIGADSTVDVMNIVGKVTISDSEMKFKTNGSPKNVQFDNTVVINDIKGVKVTESLVIKNDNNGDRIGVNTMTISGSVSESDNAVADSSLTTPKITINDTTGADENIVISEAFIIGEATVAVDGKLLVSADVDATADGAVINGTGAITVTGKITSEDTIKTTVVNAAMYTTVSPAYYVYTTLEAALAAGATDITVTGAVEIASDITIPVGTKVDVANATNVTIADDATVTVEAEDKKSGVLKNDIDTPIDVEGTLVIENLAKSGVNKNKVVSDTSKATADNVGMTYTNIYNALADAVEGDEVEITAATVTLDKDLTVPTGVTLDLNGKALVAGNNITVTIDGTIDVTDGTYTVSPAAGANDKAAVTTINGMFLYTTGAYDFVGAYFGYDGVNAIAPLTVAAGMVDDVESDIILNGDMVVGDVAFDYTGDDAPELIAKNKLTAGTIDLGALGFTASAGSVVTATIALTNGSVVLDNVTGIVIADVITYDIDNNEVYTVAISGNVAAVDDAETADVETGSVGIVGEVSSSIIAASGVTINVPADATLTITAGTIDAIIVEGTVDIDGTVSITTATVMGTIDGDATATITTLYAGVVKDDITATTAANAVIGDKVVIASAGVAYVAPGTTINDDIADLSSTEYYVEDELYLTAYAGASTSAKIIDIVAKIDNAEFNGWLNEDKNAISNTAKVGEVDKVYASINYEIFTITVNTIPGTVVYVDGIKFESATKYAAGVHTIAVYLEAGYEGTPVINVNGTTVTDSFTISGEETVITVSGVTAATGSGTIVIEPAEDEGMALTDILLIVLVVLIVIMAIIVALRMMRS